MEGAGILGSEFFQLTKAEMVKGFTGLGETVSVRPDEDLWIEMQHYRDREHRDKIFDIIRKDTSWLQLFGQFYRLVTPAQNLVMGDLNKLTI